MSKLSRLFLTTVVLSSSITATNAYATSCQGEIMAMNSGRGDLGVLFSIDEYNKTAAANSVALFSSAAIAYDSSKNYTYYVSSPRPSTYKVDVSALDVSEEELTHMPIRADKFRYTQLAYYDHASGEHNIVGRTKSAFGLAYDATNSRLLAVSYNSLFSIDTETGDTEVLADLSDIEGLTRADLVFKDGDLFLVTATSVYSINSTSYKATKMAEHGLVAVNGATLGQNGDLYISRSVINDHGDMNESRIYQLNPYTGQNCLVATLPVRINDLTTNTNGNTACYTEQLCSGLMAIPYYSEAVGVQHDTEWRTYDFGSQNFYAPAVFTSAPTFNGPHGGANRLQNIAGTEVDIAFKEWEYLDQVHPHTESFDFLALNEGRYKMSDGTILEVGSFELSGVREFADINFSKGFDSAPYIFLQTQTFNGPHTVTTRAKEITASGFKAAFSEQDANTDGHRIERVAYFAILPPAGSTSGVLETVAGNKSYALYSQQLDDSGAVVGNHQYFLVEDKSVDEETTHSVETIHVMDIEEVSLAQHVSDVGPDNISIRRK